MGIIAIHGGLDTSREKPYLEVLQEAGLKGYQLLDRGYIQALEAAINTLEDSPKFNCGYGSVLNLNGVAEMDASIVDGATGRFSAVAAIRQIQSHLGSRRLMKDRQVLLAGQGAFEFAQKEGFSEGNCISEEQFRAWQKGKDRLARGMSPSQNLFTGLEYRGDTVGCVIWDGENLGAASSTGGVSLKMPGRVGDTPCLGGGSFASRTSVSSAPGLVKPLWKPYRQNTLTKKSPGAPTPSRP